MAEYKLYYLDFAGRGEIIRLLFSAAGQKFEDVRFPREKWPEYKPKSPFGQCPYLEITEGSNTYTMAQSIAIARHLARKFSLYGKNELEASIIDMYADVLNDLVAEFAKMRRETDETKKKQLEEKIYKEIVPAHMKFFEERLAKSGSGFVVPSGLSWVDIYLFSLLDLNPSKELLFQHFKHIKENYEKVVANPGIANWLKTRPPTQQLS